MRFYKTLLWVVACPLWLAAEAGWVGPVEVLEGAWGAGVGEFTMLTGGSLYVYPNVTDVSPQGDVAIADEYKGHIKIYSATGQLKLDQYVDMGPQFVFFVGDHISVLSTSEYRVYTLSGELVSAPVLSYEPFFAKEVGGKLYVKAGGTPLWYIYGEDGSLLEQTEQWPLEVGHVSSVGSPRLGGIKYKKTKVAFTNREWVIVNKEGIVDRYRYTIDSHGFLYMSSRRYNACGKLMGKVDVQGEMNVIRSVSPYEEDTVELGVDYSSDVISDEGDFYIGKATPDGFTVLKWTWVDSPDDPNVGPMSPTNFLATPTPEGTKMKWRTSLDDPGCVSGYAIERATLAEGPFTVIHTADKGIEKYTDPNVEPDTTYYYRIQALSIVEGSEYTPVISVTGLMGTSTF